MERLMNFGILLSASTDGLPQGSIISFDSELLKSIGIIWLNVIILTVILALVLYKPVRNFLDNRTNSIKNKLDNANATQDEAEELKELYEAQLREIEKERETILSSAHKKAMERSDHILNEAKVESENIYKHTMAELEEERENLQNEIKKQLVELSVLIAGRFIDDNITAEAQDKYIEDAISDWEEGLWLN